MEEIKCVLGCFQGFGWLLGHLGSNSTSLPPPSPEKKQSRQYYFSLIFHVILQLNLCGWNMFNYTKMSKNNFRYYSQVVSCFLLAYMSFCLFVYTRLLLSGSPTPYLSFTALQLEKEHTAFSLSFAISWVKKVLRKESE